jgi:hypothetical protein
MFRRLALTIALVAALSGTARADWSTKCIASHGTCYGCCVMALVEWSFNSIGGWN